MEERMRIAFILAGGAGERFWPLSRPERPKQLLPLGEEGRTLLADTLERIRPLIGPRATYVVTGKPLLETIRSAGLEVPPGNIIAEPWKRNTAGALVFASAWLLADQGDPALDATIAVLPADHRIGPVETFRTDVEKALRTVESAGGLAVMGIPPTRPETGYGYLQRGEALEIEGLEGVARVAAFREKPDADTAVSYLDEGGYYWNSGMFFWVMSDFLTALEKAAPDHFRTIGELIDALTDRDWTAIHQIFEELEDISIDYALMEKAEDVAMIPAGFGWDDLGAWDALERILESDADGNACLGESVRIDTRGTVIVNDAGEGMTVAAVGVEGLIIVLTPEALLVTRPERAQDVREVVRQLHGEDDWR